ncbi:MAG: alpha-ketoacid dehydrogenase subunit beta [Acidobacteria bacterium]|nr:alpha-ketoacid dehydrogenase subunit beta [Acidobacteriota bacterium]MBV9477528.1 alpha-ketoacid dehydrogenase subunit beta [Acidobacteriota bacterium]
MPETTYLDAIRTAMIEEMARDERVFLIGEDVGAYGGAFKTSAGILDQFGPGRVIDTPISEVAIVGAASGAALMGMRPIAEMQFIDFITVAYDMLVNFTATSRYRVGSACPLVVRGPAGGGVHGGPFHSLNPEAMFMNRPGLKIVAPGTAYDAKGLMKAAIRDDDPVIYIEHKYLYRRIKETLPEDDYIVPIGKANRRRAGKDLTIVTWGAMIYLADEVADELAKDFISTEILDLRSILPFDEEAILESVAKTNRVLILHEAPLTGGAGAEFAARIAEKAFDYLDAPIKRVGALDVPTPYSPPLEAAALPDKTRVLAAARELLAY